MWLFPFRMLQHWCRQNSCFFLRLRDYLPLTFFSLRFRQKNVCNRWLISVRELVMVSLSQKEDKKNTGVVLKLRLFLYISIFSLFLLTLLSFALFTRFFLLRFFFLVISLTETAFVFFPLLQQIFLPLITWTFFLALVTANYTFFHTGWLTDCTVVITIYLSI